VVAFLLELASAWLERAVDPNRKGTATRIGSARALVSSGVGA
jgi:hypothetical protein